MMTIAHLSFHQNAFENTACKKVAIFVSGLTIFKFHADIFSYYVIPIRAGCKI